jgi:hypothetical protein
VPAWLDSVFSSACSAITRAPVRTCAQLTWWWQPIGSRSLAHNTGTVFAKSRCSHGLERIGRCHGLCAASRIAAAGRAGARRLRTATSASRGRSTNRSSARRACRRASSGQVALAGSTNAAGGESAAIGRQRSSRPALSIDSDGYIVTIRARRGPGKPGRFCTAMRRHRCTAFAGGRNSRPVDARAARRATSTSRSEITSPGCGRLPLANHDATLVRQPRVAQFGDDGGTSARRRGSLISTAPPSTSDGRADQSGNSGGRRERRRRARREYADLTESGGSQDWASRSERRRRIGSTRAAKFTGHLHRGLMGFSMQAITPALAANLSRPRASSAACFAAPGWRGYGAALTYWVRCSRWS